MKLEEESEASRRRIWESVREPQEGSMLRVKCALET